MNEDLLLREPLVGLCKCCKQFKGRYLAHEKMNGVFGRVDSLDNELVACFTNHGKTGYLDL